MTTPSSNQFGQNMSSPFLGVVPRTPAMYQRFTFASESPAAAVPQLYIVAKSPEYDRGLTQRVPKTPATATPVMTRSSNSFFGILQSVGITPGTNGTDNQTGTQVVPSGFSPFLPSPTEKLSQLNTREGDTESSDSQETDACNAVVLCNNRVISCHCHSETKNKPSHKVRFTQQNEVKQLNLFGEEEDIFEQ